MLRVIGKILKWIFVGAFTLIAVVVGGAVGLAIGGIVIGLPWLIIMLALMMAWGHPTIWSWVLLAAMVVAYVWTREIARS